MNTALCLQRDDMRLDLPLCFIVRAFYGETPLGQRTVVIRFKSLSSSNRGFHTDGLKCSERSACGRFVDVHGVGGVAAALGDNRGSARLGGCADGWQN
jgi:hypothetical protein